ncbi:MAG: DUF2877 domain-containing protein [Armatimonadota bacterium]|nr:DUF2877 domain-containing protein [Armatimonadota bacterium]
MEHNTLPPSPLLHALSLSRRAHGILQLSHRGTVIASFSRSCYAELSGQIVAFVSVELGNGPLNVVVADPAVFRHLTPGTPLVVTRETIHFGSDLTIAWDKATIWEARYTPWNSFVPQRLLQGLAAVRATLATEAPSESLARILEDTREAGGAFSPMLVRAREAMRMLQEALERDSPALAARAAKGLAGLGPGLTPSGDDVLAGVLLALAVLPRESHETLREAITSIAPSQTHRISAAYLAAAREGEASEAWHRLLDVTLRGDPTAITPAVRKVMAYGETSGADMLAGFLLAAGAILRKHAQDFPDSLENTASNCTVLCSPNP